MCVCVDPGVTAASREEGRRIALSVVDSGVKAASREEGRRIGEVLF
jgi:hypothetical protein